MGSLVTAMGDTPDEVKAVADYVTLDVEHSGMAAIEKFLLQLITGGRVPEKSAVSSIYLIAHYGLLLKLPCYLTSTDNANIPVLFSNVSNANCLNN